MILDRNKENGDRELKFRTQNGREFRTAENFNALSRHLLRCATQGILRVDFFRTLSETLLSFVGCDLVELRQKERNRFYRSEAIIDGQLLFRFNAGRDFFEKPASVVPQSKSTPDLDELCMLLLGGYSDPGSSLFTAGGSFWTGDSNTPVHIVNQPEVGQERILNIKGEFPSLAIIPFSGDVERSSLLLLKSKKPNFFTSAEIIAYEGVAQNIGVALVHRHAQVALRERVKELTCL